MFRTFGGVLSPGLTSYQVATGAAPFQPSSDNSPSILIDPVAREMCSVSPARLVCASSVWAWVNTSNRNAAATRRVNVIVMPINAESGAKPLERVELPAIQRFPSGQKALHCVHPHGFPP